MKTLSLTYLLILAIIELSLFKGLLGQTGLGCPEKLTQDGSCLKPASSDHESPRTLFNSELDAIITARCYATCVQNSTGSGVS